MLLRIEIVRLELENVIALRKKGILIDPIGSRSGLAERRKALNLSSCLVY